MTGSGRWWAFIAFIAFVPCLYAGVNTSQSGERCDAKKEFHCAFTGECINANWKCDLIPDCEDGTDESGCPDVAVCKPGQFKCKGSGKCIPMAWICDGEGDCTDDKDGKDDSDEDPSQCHRFVHCPGNTAQCGNSTQCVAIKSFCDKKKDCENGADEGIFCVEDSNSPGLNCSDGYRITSRGPRCFCETGMQPNAWDCIDLNECAIEGSCDQICHNTEGSFACDCVTGYKKFNYKTCEAINVPFGEEATVVFSTTNEIRRISASNGSSYESAPVGMEMQSVSVTFDHRNRSICYIRISRQAEVSVACSDASDFSQQWILPQPSLFSLDSSSHLALDWVSGNFYFVDGFREMIYVCSSDMKSCKILIDANISKPRAIALDPTKGLMFFTKWGSTSPSLERASLAGEDRSALVERKIVYPFGVAVDFPLEHVYWVDTYLDFVERVNYDGTHRQTIKKGFPVQNLYDITVFENDLFVSSWKYLSILKLNKFHPEVYETLVANISRPFSVLVYHRQRQPEVVHPCKTNNGGCQHICITAWTTKGSGTERNGFSHCVCKPGFTAIGNGKCAAFDKNLFLIYGKKRPSMIKGVPISAENHAMVEETIPPIMDVYPTVIDYDAVENFIYYVDGTRNVIERRKLEESKKELVVKLNHNGCRGMAVDWMGRNLYWSDENAGTIIVAGMKNFTKQRTLMKEKRCKPRSVALDPESGMMYWSRWTRVSCVAAIEKAFMDGSNRTVLVKKNLHWPTGLNVDSLTAKLYWSDSFHDSIERVDLDGKNREVVFAKKVNHPYGLAIARDVVFWTEHQKGLIKSYNWVTRLDTVFAVENKELSDVKVFDRMKQTEPVGNYCDSCDGICVTTPLGDKCLCRDGYIPAKEECVAPILERGNSDKSETCEADSFTCRDGTQCVNKVLVCDGTKDCWDGSDEDVKTLCGNVTCPKEQFKCDGTKCIPKHWICDGEYDCADRMDESKEQCSLNTCQPDHFSCVKSKRCISALWVCDGDYDCGEGDISDEAANCTPRKCLPTEFACKSGACISTDLVCNGVNDCHECPYVKVEDCQTFIASDEDSCFNVCDRNEFYCEADKKCVDKSNKCDGKADCSDRLDELGCVVVACNERNQGLGCVNFNASVVVCKHPNRLCDNGERCMLVEEMCDGRQDCRDGSDEGYSCDEDLCGNPDSLSRCSHACYNTPDGFVCGCPEGYYLAKDNVTCSTMKPCDSWGTCSQVCVPSGKYSHKCACHSGYELEPDHFTCKSTDGSQPFLIFSTSNEIRKINVKNRSSKTLTTALKNTVSLDFYVDERGKITLFWADVLEVSIFRGDLDSDGLVNVSAIVTAGLSNVEGIAVDWIGGNLYWIESSLSQIEVAKLNGSFRHTLVTGDMESPRGIAVDPRYGLLFWTDWGDKLPRIEKCDMSGENRSIFVKMDDIQDGEWPYGLTLDYQMKRVYWADASSQAIFTVDYEGDNARIIAGKHDFLQLPFAITLYENNLYWTDWKSHAVVKCNKWNGSDISIVQETLSQPFGIKMAHSSRQPRLAGRKNACEVDNGNCSHLCLISSDNGFKCACPRMMILTMDNVTCVKNEVFLLFSRPSEIRGADLNHPYYQTVSVISGDGAPLELEFAAESQYVYWIDAQMKEVKRASISGGVVGSVLDTGVENPSGLAIDWISKIMFISSGGESPSIYACNLDGEYLTEIYSSPTMGVAPDERILSTTSLAVLPETGALFYTVKYANGNYAIYQTDMIGSKLLKLTSTDTNSYLQEPADLWADGKSGKLFWLNKGMHIIQHMDLNDFRLITLPLDGSPSTFTIYGDWLYYANSADDSIHMANKFRGYDDKIFRKNTSDVYGMIVYDGKTQMGGNACKPLYEEGPKCAHLCMVVSTFEAVCKCAIGYESDASDRGKCRGVEEFVLFSLNWEIKGITEGGKKAALAPISHISMASSVDFLAEEDLIFWADSDHGTITRIKRDGSERRVIVGTANHDVTETDWLAGIAVDWIARNIYWTDPRLSVIEACRLDGSHRRVMVRSKDKPISVAVDPLAGFLFWNEVGEGGCRVKRATLDGKNVSDVTSDSHANINDITLDYENKVLYWSNASGIYSVSYDGMVKKRLLSRNLGNPIGLVVHENRIYWIDISHNNGSMKVAFIDAAFNYTEILSNAGDSLRDVTIFSQKRQRGRNPCSDANGGCAQLCFYDGKKASCACSHGSLDSDRKNCKAYDVFIMYSRVNQIDSLHMTDENEYSPPYPPLKSKHFINNIIALAYNYASSILYFSDIRTGVINAVHFNGTNFRTVVTRAAMVEGLVYDPVDNTLIWTCFKNSSINMLNLDNERNEPKIVVQLRVNDKPRSIDVDSCELRIYWTNWNEHRPSIQRAHKSGYMMESIITKDIKIPNSLALDHKSQKLYWADAALDKIERCEYDGRKRVILVRSKAQHIFDVAIYKDFLYWTDWMSRSVLRCDKYTGSNIVALRKNVPNVMGIVAIANNSLECMWNKCKRMNGGCDDICELDAMGNAVCSCKNGRPLLSDGYRCASEGAENVDMKCSETDFKCSDSFCIPFEKTCDGTTQCPDGSDEDTYYCDKRECPPMYFSCDGAKCIRPSLKCDGKLECEDETDEQNCPCSEDQFVCPSGKCIMKEFVCDGSDECPDGADEKNCSQAAECSSLSLVGIGRNYVKCNTTKQCIFPQWVCDGHNDCGDNSDELNCPINDKTECTEDKFKCKDQKFCIHQSWVCDNDEDCPDGSDELNCDSVCPNDHFQCTDKETCILRTWLCDGYLDCKDGSDESAEDCKARSCSSKEFRCGGNSRCIPLAWVCDKEFDCRDGSDESIEQDCIPYFEAKCRHDEFLCQNKKCIPTSYYCDGYNDCGDNSDEPRSCRVCELPNDFLCHNGKCVPLSVTCDGKDACGDNSDENEFLCQRPAKNNTSPCHVGEYKCGNGKCVVETAVCNGADDCGDFSDEESCNVNECAANKTLCQHGCVDRKIGYECICDGGFQPHPTLPDICVDVNECKGRPCSQICANERGSYKCSCAKGYAFAPNGISCKSISETPTMLLLANKHYIRELKSDFGEVVMLAHNLSNVVSLDYDWDAKCVYWSEVTNAVKMIQKQCEGDESPVALHVNNLASPDGVAVDWIGKNLYWCDKGRDVIEVSKLNGKFRKVLIGDKSLLQEPRAIALDPIRGYMYWTDWGNNPYIGKGGMDGKKYRILINDTLGWPNALTLSWETNEIFWGDAKLDYIAVADLDGNNRQIIISKSTHPSVPLHHIFAIAVFEDHIFWSDWETSRVEKCHKYTGVDCNRSEPFVHRPMDMKIYHPYKQPKIPHNPCDSLECQGLCLLTPDPMWGVCDCPVNYILAKDKQTCYSNCSKGQFECPFTFKCIPRWWKCDGHDDCGDRTDEPPHCREFNCVPGQFQCFNPTDKCIHPIGICDGKRDCPDGSDEFDCDTFECLETHFKCAANSTQKAVCISNGKKCNGQKDCLMGEDEENCGEKRCEPNEFKCGNGKCIPYVGVCDGEKDCEDGLDEMEHVCANNKCPDGYMRCGTGRCVMDSWYCDGEMDCPGGEDEPTTCSNRTCDVTYFKCANNKCIPGRWRCDYYDDCRDNSDEIDCVYRNCSESEFRCRDGRCIRNTLVCNGKYDCEDQSDEAGCENITCSHGFFPCQNNTRCIPNHWICDGEIDCLDRIDEVNCEKNCSGEEFTCGNGECLPESWICDGDKDCGDGSDEKAALCATKVCPPSRYRCRNNVCVLRSAVCDGKNNCGDNSDEDPDACAYMDKCQPHEWKCRNARCVSVTLLCDGSNDCGDNSDETTCHSTRGECKIGHCTQSCAVKKYGAHCYCAKGYALMQDNRTCYALGDPSYMAIAVDWDLSVVDPGKAKDNYLRRIPVSKPGYKIDTFDVLWHKGGSSVFWSTKQEHAIYSTKIPSDYNGSLSSSKADKTNYTGNILVLTEGEVQSIAVDWINENLYWIEDGHNREVIMASNVKGQFKYTLINEDIYKPRDIVVDPNKGLIFWSECGKYARIESCTLDGSKRTHLVKDSLHWPVGITADYPASRIYWIDSKLRFVECVNYDGTDRNMVYQFPSGMKPYKVDLFENYLYVALLQRNYIARVHKFAQENLTRIEAGASRILDVVVFQQYKQSNLIEAIPSKAHYSSMNNSICFFDGLKTTCVCGDSFILKDSQCVCKKGWMGGNCELPVKKCQFCLNGGECEAKMPMRCKCPAGFTGPRCEQCQNMRCHNGGACVKAPDGSEKCVCLLGYYGRICNESKCDNYCKQGGCTLSGNTPKCNCPAGYTGKKCEHSCKDTCLNGGTCHISVKDVFCTCQWPFNGRRCEINLCDSPNAPSECKNVTNFTGGICEKSCVNGGTCHNIDGNSYCECLYEWTGHDCSKQVVQGGNDEGEEEACESDYCKNGGLCLNGLDGRPFCHCQYGWMEERCTFHPECKGYCFNFGVCSVNGTAAVCSCPKAFGGERCEIPVISYDVSRLPLKLHAWAAVVITTFVFVAFYFIAKRREYGNFVRFAENGAVNNPIYLSGDLEEDGGGVSEHSLPLNDKITFANPVYDSIYNSNGSGGTEAANAANEEKKGLLMKEGNETSSEKSYDKNNG